MGEKIRFKTSVPAHPPGAGTTTAVEEEPIPFVQILEGRKSVMALDANGDVWMFQGQNYGWRRMNPHRMTDDEVQELTAKREQFASSSDEET